MLSTPLHLYCGASGPYALELKAVGAEPRLHETAPGRLEGELPAGWQAAAVLTADDQRGLLRLYRLTPAGTPAEIAFHGFHVRGAFVAEAVDGKPRDLNLAWAAWRGE
ncbi:MAG TPA: hypothetical protein VKB51_02220 [bacterium]|nr:hypothetical protein [bacterium]